MYIVTQRKLCYIIKGSAIITCTMIAISLLFVGIMSEVDYNFISITGLEEEEGSNLVRLRRNLGSSDPSLSTADKVSNL